jgi:hypothetical protein
VIRGSASRTDHNISGGSSCNASGHIKAKATDTSAANSVSASPVSVSLPSHYKVKAFNAGTLLPDTKARTTGHNSATERVQKEVSDTSFPSTHRNSSDFDNNSNPRLQRPFTGVTGQRSAGDVVFDAVNYSGDYQVGNFPSVDDYLNAGTMTKNTNNAVSTALRTQSGNLWGSSSVINTIDTGSITGTMANMSSMKATQSAEESAETQVPPDHLAVYSVPKNHHPFAYDEDDDW